MKSKILVDTDVLIWFLKGNEDAYRKLESADEILMSAISYMELVQGLRNKSELTALNRFIRDWEIRVVLIDERITQHAMSLVEQFFLSHTLHLSNGLIAATAIEHGVSLLTGNVKHFKPIAALDLIPFRTYSRVESG